MHMQAVVPNDAQMRLSIPCCETDAPSQMSLSLERAPPERRNPEIVEKHIERALVLSMTSPTH